ncbi:MAG TPA: MarR family transcriptional regulator [Actinophytocola sp.]|nr:MarR family transcriptional regulator [Actinophytocola sp.]
MGEKDRLIERIEQAEDRFLRLTAITENGPLQSVDLTMRQLRVLLILSFSDGLAGRELAAALGVGLAAVTGIADRLAARELVRRAEDPADRRVRRVYLTEAGRAVVTGLRDAGREGKRRLLRRLTAAELRDYARTMDVLNAAAETER